MIYLLKNETIVNECLDYIDNLHKDTVWVVEITKYKKDRSQAQSRLMWLWLGIISNDTGNSPDELHEIFKLKFLGSETLSALGFKIERPKSTTKLTTQEFTDYLDKIEGLAISIGIRLPRPEDLYRESMGL